MKRYLIICEETCPKCGGGGRVVVKSEDPGISYKTESAQRITTDCNACIGTGTVREEVDLAEAIKEVKRQEDINLCRIFKHIKRGA